MSSLVEQNRPEQSQKAPEKRALARGLSSLLGPTATAKVPTQSVVVNAIRESVVEAPNETQPEKEPTLQTLSSGEFLVELELSQIEANPEQPRKAFNEAAIQELADSLKEQGLIQPIVVKKVSGDSPDPTKNRYQIIAGERRWRAAQLAKLNKVAAIVRAPANEVLHNEFASIIENLQREDLNAIELAEAYDRLIKSHQLTQEELAKRLGISRVRLANTLRLLKLPSDVRTLVSKGELSEGHARALLSLENETRIRELASLCTQLRLSVREIEARVKSSLGGPGANTSAASRAETERSSSPAKTKDPQLLSLEDELRQLLGTKVTLNGNSITGMIEIYYTGSDSLKRLVHQLRATKGA